MRHTIVVICNAHCDVPSLVGDGELDGAVGCKKGYVNATIFELKNMESHDTY